MQLNRLIEALNGTESFGVRSRTDDIVGFNSSRKHGLRDNTETHVLHSPLSVSTVLIECPRVGGSHLELSKILFHLAVLVSRICTRGQPVWPWWRRSGFRRNEVTGVNRANSRPLLRFRRLMQAERHPQRYLQRASTCLNPFLQPTSSTIAHKATAIRLGVALSSFTAS